MKRILHIPNYYAPHIGGIEQVANDIFMSLRDEEYEQRLICFNDKKQTVCENIGGLDLIRVGCFANVASQSLSFSYGKELKKLMNDFKPDIVIFHAPNPFVAHYLKKYFKRKSFELILWWHLDITKQKLLGKLFEGQNQKLLKTADKIVATSPNYIQGSKYLSKYKDKCSVVPCCVNKDRISCSKDEERGALKIKEENKGKTICFAFGRHVEYKGLTYLIQASKSLPDNFKIYIGGSGPLTDSLKEEAKADSKVEFLGRLSDEDLKSYMIACDIFCFPSITKNEAFGIGLAEAMAFGKPTITFTIDGSGVNYVNLNEVTGLEVKNGDVDAYAKAILKLSQNPDLMKEYSASAAKRVEELFTQERFKDNLLNLLEK